MVVAVVAVRVVKVASHQIIDVRDSLMAASGAVPMAFVVLAAIVSRRAVGWD